MSRLLNSFVCENLRPKASESVRVLDFNHSELLQDTVVESEFLLFEHWDYFVADVQRKQVVQLLVSCDLALVSLKLVSHSACI